MNKINETVVLNVMELLKEPNIYNIRRSINYLTCLYENWQVDERVRTVKERNMYDNSANLS